MLEGGDGRDIFVIAPGEGIDTILDFTQGEDLIGLAGGLSFGQLTIETRGRGMTTISLEQDNGREILALLRSGQFNTLTEANFTTNFTITA